MEETRINAGVKSFSQNPLASIRVAGKQKAKSGCYAFGIPVPRRPGAPEGPG